MNFKMISAGLLVVCLTLFASIVTSFADTHSNSEDDFDSEHRLIIQINTDDPRTQDIALNNIVNLQKHYGIDNIEIEVVAYGPGLHMLTTKSPVMQRITSLMQSDVVFTACGNTIDTIHETTGKKPEIIDGIGNVQTGVARIIELQEAGWSYVRP